MMIFRGRFGRSSVDQASSATSVCQGVHIRSLTDPLIFAPAFGEINEGE